MEQALAWMSWGMSNTPVSLNLFIHSVTLAESRLAIS